MKKCKTIIALMILMVCYFSNANAQPINIVSDNTWTDLAIPAPTSSTYPPPGWNLPGFTPTGWSTSTYPYWHNLACPTPSTYVNCPSCSYMPNSTMWYNSGANGSCNCPIAPVDANRSYPVYFIKTFALIGTNINASTLQMSFGSDDGGKVYINGHLVANPNPTTVAEKQAIVDMLQCGPNVVGIAAWNDDGLGGSTPGANTCWWVYFKLSFTGAPSTLTLSSTPTCPGQCSGTISVSETGGSPSTYTWSPSGANNPANNLCAGTYSVTVQDHNGCSITGSTNVGLYPAVTATYNNLVIPCSSTKIDVNAVFANGTPFTLLGFINYYKYSTVSAAGPWTNSFGNATFNNMGPGAHTFWVQDRNCVWPITFTVTHATTSAGTDQTVCLGSTAILHASGTGNWSVLAPNLNPAPTTFNNSSSPTVFVSGLTVVGDYTFRWTNGSCTDDVVVHVIAGPNAGADQTICAGTTATMAATGTGFWSVTLPNTNPPGAVITPGNSPTAVVAGLNIPGNYTFIWNSGGCKSAVHIHVVNAVTAGTNKTLSCIRLPGGIVTMNATGAGHWTVPLSGGTLPVNPGTANIVTANSPTTVVNNFSAAGVYHFIWSNGTCSSTVTVTVTATPIVGGTQTVGCFTLPGGTAALTATGAGTWTFLSGPGVPTLVPPTNVPNVTVNNFPTPGNYTFQFTNADGCSATTLIRVRGVKPGPNQTVSCVQSFPGGTATMGATATVFFPPGQWSAASGNPGTATITNVNNPTTTITNFSAAGIYHFKWSENGCPADVTVTVTGAPSAGPDQTLQCGDFTGGGAVMTASGTGTWSPLPAGVTMVDVTNPIGIATFNNSGSYTLTWTSGSCSDQVVITVPAPCCIPATCEPGGCSPVPSANLNTVTHDVRIGHLQNGIFGAPAPGTSINPNVWSALGLADIGAAPNTHTLYGLSIQNRGDKAFFGTRPHQGFGNLPLGSDAILAWGDDNIGGPSFNRMIFEFHNAASCGNSTPTEIATMLPNGFVGIHTLGSAPTAILHVDVSTQAINEGVRLQGLPNQPYALAVVADPDGNLAVRPFAGGGSGGIAGAENGTSVNTADNKVVLGQDVSDPGNPAILTNDREIPLSGHNVDFSGTGAVGIGTVNPQATRLHVGAGSLSGLTGGPFPEAAVSTTDDYSDYDGGMLALVNADPGNELTTYLDKGGSVLFGGRYNTGNSAIAGFARVDGKKEDGVDGNYTGYLAFDTRNGGLNERMRITSAGDVGIGTTQPKDKLDVIGTERVQTLPAGPNQGIVMYGNGSSGQTNQLHSLALSNSATDVLHGDGTWAPGGTGGGAIGAENGTSVNTNNKVVLGQDINQIGAPAALLNDREVPLNGHNVDFTGTGRVGIGTTAPAAVRLHVGAGSLSGLTGARFPEAAVSATDDYSPYDGGMVAIVNGDPGNIGTNNYKELGGSLLFGGRYSPSSSGVAGFARVIGRKENSIAGSDAGYLALETRLDNSSFYEHLRITNAGNVGINTTSPTDDIDVHGTARIETLPPSPNDGIVMYGNGSGGQSNQLHSLAFTNSSTDVLHGDGTWGPSSGGGSTTTADNGLEMNPTLSNVQLGQSGPAASTGPAQLLRESYIPLHDHILNFTDAGASQGYLSNRIGVGLPLGNSPKAKVDIFRPFMTTGREFNPTGLLVTNNDAASDGNSIAIKGIDEGFNTTTNNGNNTNIGGYFQADLAYNENFGGQFWGSTGQRAYGLTATGHSGSAINTGANVTGYGDANTTNYGVSGQAYSSSMTGTENYGGHFSAVNGASNYGVYATGSNGSTAYGGFFRVVTPAASVANYGVCGDLSGLPAPASGNTVPYFAVYGLAPTSTATAGEGVGTGVNTLNCYAGYFEGDVYGSNYYFTSDPKLKKDITSYSGALDQLSKLPVKKYNFRNNEYPKMNLPQGSQIGLLSTDLKTVFPNLVKSAKHPGNGKEDKEVEFEAVNYISLIPVLVQAVKELDAKKDSISSLKTDLENVKTAMAGKIEALQKQIDDICNGGCAGLMGSSATGQTDQTGNKLFQNVPNPFSNQTVISYILNTGTTAYMNINALDGKLIKKIDLSVKGRGSVSINSAEFSAGTYTYTLYVDDTVVDTKLMVITSRN